MTAADIILHRLLEDDFDLDDFGQKDVYDPAPPPLEQELAAFMDKNILSLDGEVTRHSNHYVHQRSTSLSLDVSYTWPEYEGEEEDEEAGPEDAARLQANEAAFFAAKRVEEERVNKLVDELEAKMSAQIIKWNDKIYSELEAAYDDSVSDEVASANIIANNYMFTTEGERSEDEGSVDYTQLTPEAQEKAREWWVQADLESGDNSYSEPVMAEWRWLLDSKGFHNVEINYSGFWSQGDGASFTARGIDFKKYFSFPDLLEFPESERRQMDESLTESDEDAFEPKDLSYVKPYGYVLKSQTPGSRHPWFNSYSSDRSNCCGNFRRYIGDATVFKRLNTTKQYSTLDAVPVYSDPRRTGEQALDSEYAPKAPRPMPPMQEAASEPDYDDSTKDVVDHTSPESVALEIKNALSTVRGITDLRMTPGTIKPDFVYVGGSIDLDYWDAGHALAVALTSFKDTPSVTVTPTVSFAAPMDKYSRRFSVAVGPQTVKENLEERYGGAAQERGIYYHGTSSRLIPAILSQGLIPDPKVRSWDRDPNPTNAINPTRRTTFGIYVTDRLGSATQAAQRVARRDKANQAIVVMELQPRSISGQEDDVSFAVNSLGVNSQGVVSSYVWPWFMEVYGDRIKHSIGYYQKEHEKQKSAWVVVAMKRILRHFKDDPHPELEERVSNLLYQEGYRLMLERTISYCSGWDKDYYEREWEHNFGSDYPPRLPDSDKAEADWLAFTGKLTRTLKDLARPIKARDDWQNNGRLLQPVRFNGSNRIVCIVERVDAPNFHSSMQVHYGEPPQKLLDDWNETIGSLDPAMDIFHKNDPAHPDNLALDKMDESSASSIVAALLESESDDFKDVSLGGEMSTYLVYTYDQIDDPNYETVWETDGPFLDVPGALNYAIENFKEGRDKVTAMQIELYFNGNLSSTYTVDQDFQLRQGGIDIKPELAESMEDDDFNDWAKEVSLPVDMDGEWGVVFKYPIRKNLRAPLMIGSFAIYRYPDEGDPKMVAAQTYMTDTLGPDPNRELRRRGRKMIKAFRAIGKIFGEGDLGMYENAWEWIESKGYDRDQLIQGIINPRHVRESEEDDFDMKDVATDAQHWTFEIKRGYRDDDPPTRTRILYWLNDSGSQTGDHLLAGEQTFPLRTPNAELRLIAQAQIRQFQKAGDFDFDRYRNVWHWMREMRRASNSPDSQSSQVPESHVDEIIKELLENTFDDVASTFKDQATPDEIEQAIDQFKLYRQRQLIRGPAGDISRYAGKYSELRGLLDQTAAHDQQKQAIKRTEEDAEVVLDNDRVLVVVPNTFEASKKYGAGTKWCVSGRVRDHWDKYTSNSIKFYFIITKDRPNTDDYHKVAIAVRLNHEVVEAYSATNYLLKNGAISEFLKIYGLDSILFTNKADWSSWLDRHDHSTNSDGTVDINDDVDLSGMKLENLPMKFGRVAGNFICFNNRLVSIEGAPTEVGGDFNCSENRIVSLKGAPSKVVGEFNCSENHITSLEGAPASVGGTFDCSNNKLKSLEGAPEVVGRDFKCSINQLTSLTGSPLKVKGNFYCNHNRLKSLSGAPTEVRASFYCNNNLLTALEGAPATVGGDFYCNYNRLVSLAGSPKTVGRGFYCTDNALTSLEGAPASVGKDFGCSNNPLAPGEEDRYRDQIKHPKKGQAPDQTWSGELTPMM